MMDRKQLETDEQTVTEYTGKQTQTPTQFVLLKELSVDWQCEREGLVHGLKGTVYPRNKKKTYIFSSYLWCCSSI